MVAALHLPPRQITGFAGGVYTEAARVWRDVPIRAADKNPMPVAWTSYLQSLAAGTTENAWLAAHSYVLPQRRWADAGSQIMLPRTVLMDTTAFPGINIGNIVTSLIPALNAKKVMVASTSTAFQHNYDAIIRMFLPHTGLVNVTHFAPLAHVYTATFGDAAPNNWQAGQVLYLDCLTTLQNTDSGGNPQVIAPGSVFNPGVFGYEEMAEWNAYGEGRITLQKPRYEKFGYHCIWCLAPSYPTVPTWDSTGRALQRAQFVTVINAFAGAVTADIFDASWPANQASIEGILKSKIQAFFGV